MEQQIAQRAAVAGARQKFIVGVYLWMAAALMVTGVSAVFAASSEAFIRFAFGSRWTFFGLIIDEFALVWYLSANIRTMTKSAAMAAFFGYSVLNGLTLSVIFLVYTAQSIGQVFFMAAAMFGGMSIYGLVTKRDLMKAGHYLMMGLWGVIIASLINMFLRSSGFDWLISIVTVAVFTGLTAWDAQKLQRIAVAPEGSDIAVKQSIFGALQLYLDFINLFLALLRLFGNRRR
ncbi:MAG: Bax inhibitor-1/YccA family protein [Spirochaetaceae bacterium]|jgi:FtsH-binding integral membrane protein|nr:Bax inhibitor-1/YccA family protein [Spirochaetaceae bacterium]